MVYSASLVVAHNQLNDDTYFLVRQVISAGIGLVVMTILARIDYRLWRSFSLIALLVTVALLVAVLMPGVGVAAGGSSRWVKLPVVQLQPSELIKLVLVLYMADWLARKGSRVAEFWASSVPFLIILGLVCALVVAEPDFGTTVIIALTAISIFWIAGANVFQFAGGLGFIGLVGVLVMQHSGYRNQRLLAWIDPWQDRLGYGWHTIQTLIAMGSGGLTGVGLGESRQKHSWLDNAHTDAILAVIGEELGLIGTLVVIALLAVVVWRGIRIAYNGRDAYARLLAAGLTTTIFWQAAINIAVVTNSAPYTGVPLPFVSFGGSSLVVSMAIVGLLLSIQRYSEAAARADQPGIDTSRPGRPPRRPRVSPPPRPRQPAYDTAFNTSPLPESTLAFSRLDWLPGRRLGRG
jgi:cell division protein FtsW